MTERIDGTGHFGKPRRMAIPLARDHLTQAHSTSIAGQSGSARPAFKGHLLGGCGNSVEVVVEPERVLAQYFGFLRDARHRLIRLRWVRYTGQVHAPSLRHNYSVIHDEKTPLFSPDESYSEKPAKLTHPPQRSQKTTSSKDLRPFGFGV